MVGNTVLLFGSELGKQFLWIVLPLAAFAAVFHGIEVVVQRRLVQRFGWQAALWTGWIGTPIHELSHVVVCWVFGHQVEAVALFEPDRNEGRLGYVRHSYHRGNWWQEAGNFFIGIAPLFGGAIGLLMVTWAMYPSLVDVFFQLSGPASNGKSESVSGSWDTVSSIWPALANTLNVLSLRFWLFFYLILCIAMHTAPSGSDYHGGFKGGVILVAAWISLNLLYALAGYSLSQSMQFAHPIWLLGLILLALASLIAMAAAGGVYIVTVIWDAIKRR